jgi:protein TonB
MFENSLVESRVLSVSSSKRWTTLASISLQLALAATVIALPLLHPDALPFHMKAPKVLLPLLPKPPIQVKSVERAPTASHNVLTSVPTERVLMRSLLPRRDIATDEAPSLEPIGRGMGVADAPPGGMATGVGEDGPSVSIAPARAPVGRVHISSGVSQGMLIAPIRPVYPAIAKAAHVTGTVVVEAVISRIGTIESLRVISGPVMLQDAAIEAIRAARYKPYRLNGEATEVQTTITVNFKMEG